jgi:hypothetical protein
MTIRAKPRRVIIEAKGGLGNQMFQYAAARSLSLELDAELLVERKIGFMLDRRYHRTFELNRFPVVFSESTFKDSYPLYFDRLFSFVGRWLGGKHRNWKITKFVFERDFSFMDFRKRKFQGKRLWMSGYFQDPRYFALFKKRILAELNPPLPSDTLYLEIGKLSENFTLIALGIRLFEESSTPDVHSRMGKNKTIEDYMPVLTKLVNLSLDPIILVFSTKEFDFLKSLRLPARTIFINSDQGFHSTVDKLWLLTKCRHHVFNNSTFYWWGAALSELNFSNTIQEIYCSDNFLNPDIHQPHWKTF